MTPPITPRQREALRHRALGLTNAATAAEMGIAETTLKETLKWAYRRLDASCLEDALRAVGWLTVPEE